MALFLPPSPDSLVEEEDFTPPPVESFVSEKPTPLLPPESTTPTFQPPLEITPEGPVYGYGAEQVEFGEPPPLTPEVAPFKRATRGIMEAGAGVAKALASESELGPMAPPGTYSPQLDEAWRQRMARTKPEVIEDIRTNPLYQAGVVTEESKEQAFPLTPSEEVSKIGSAIETGTGMAGYVASGSTLAPALIGMESFTKHIVEDYDKWREEGMSNDEAATKAFDTAVKSGGVQAAAFAALPPALRKLGDAYLIDRFGRGVVSDFLAKRAAQVSEGAALMGSVQAAENVVTGKPITEGVGEAAKGGAVLFGLTPRGGGPEKITESAWRDPETGKVYYGANHPEILQRQGKPVPSRAERNTPEFGYRTDRRPFVNREQGSEIAKRSDQQLEPFDEKGTQPHSDQIAAEPGGTTAIAEAPLKGIRVEEAPVTTESDVSKMSKSEQGELNHTRGIDYGVGLTDVDVPRLEGEYKKAGKDMVSASMSGDNEGMKAAFGRYNFFGGALQGATRGAHTAAAGNYALWLKNKSLAGKQGFTRKITNPWSDTQIRDHLETEHGLGRDNKNVTIVENPDTSILGEINPRTGKIEINRLAIDNPKDLNWVWDHERAHKFDLDNPGAVAQLRRTITGQEWTRINDEVVKAGYEASQHLRERDARVITTLADAWKGRSWFERLVKRVQLWAGKKGIEMDRAAAERAAVRALAEATKSIKSQKWQPKTATTERPLMGKKGEEEPETMGVRQSTREDMAKRGEPVVSVRGEGTNLKQALTQGREILGRDPDAAERAFEEFNNTGRLSERDFNVSRAKYEQVMTEGRKIEKQFGTDSPEYHAARMEAARWSDVTKRMQTEWHRLGMGQQGETDIDTGSVLDMETKHKADTGKDFTPQQRKRATVIAGKVDTANTAANTAREALYNETAKGKSLSKAEKDALDAASKTVREAAIRMAEAQNKQRVANEALKQAIDQVQIDAARRASVATSKTIREAAIRAAKAENAARIKAAKRAKELADIQVKAAQKALDAVNKRARTAAIKSAQAEQKSLSDPARALWDKAKEYIDQGMDNFDDIRNKLATDLGMSVNKVTKLMTQTKRAKFLADDMWRKQQVARQVHTQAKMWLRNLETPAYQKAIAAVPRALFSLKVGFHGTVALGTHVPMVAFQPRFWKVYIQNFARMYRMIGKPSYYERQIQDLQRRPNYVTAQRAGLVNDPFQYEEYYMSPIVGKMTSVAPKTMDFFNKATGMGNRGYSVLKIIRQDMFDQMWNKLPKTSQIPEMAEALSDGINHATGVVKGRAPAGTNIALFAPRLEASRVMWLVGDPIRAANTFLNWKNSNIGERAFAVNQIKEKAWVAGTLFGALAINQGFLSAVGSDQKINGLPESMGGAGFDPFRHDFMKFKAAGMNLSYGNPMMTMARLPLRLWIGIKNEGRFSKMVYEDENVARELFKYARTQASPFLGLILNLGLGRDFMERPLPRAGFGLLEGKTNIPKRLQAEGITSPYTWTELWSEQLAPIPFQEALVEVWKTGMGMSEEQIVQMKKAMATIAVMSATGARFTEDIQYEPRLPRTFREAVEQQK